MSRRKNPLRELLERVPEDKQTVGAKIVEELLFMEETLTRLKAQVRETGEVEHFQQGKQDFYRESPALKAYNTTVQRYGNLYKQLTDLIGKTPEAEKKNPVYDFIKGA